MVNKTHRNIHICISKNLHRLPGSDKYLKQHPRYYTITGEYIDRIFPDVNHIWNHCTTNLQIPHHCKSSSTRFERHTVQRSGTRYRSPATRSCRYAYSNASMVSANQKAAKYSHLLEKVKAPQGQEEVLILGTTTETSPSRSSESQGDGAKHK